MDANGPAFDLSYSCEAMASACCFKLQEEEFDMLQSGYSVVKPGMSCASVDTAVRVDMMEGCFTPS